MKKNFWFFVVNEKGEGFSHKGDKLTCDKSKWGISMAKDLNEAELYAAQVSFHNKQNFKVVPIN
jgi:hypothetical protein